MFAKAQWLIAKGFTCSQATCDDGKLPTRWVAVGHGGTILAIVSLCVIREFGELHNMLVLDDLAVSFWPILILAHSGPIPARVGENLAVYERTIENAWNQMTK